MTEFPHKRRIRSFVMRTGRLTHSQSRALEQLWPEHGLDISQHISETTFAKQQPLVLEIGFGNGESLASMAQNHPELNFIGIEVHTPGVGHLLSLIEKHGLTNIKIYEHDAVEVLEQCIADSSIHRLQLFFPDPWHKKRHHKRRLVQTAFADLVTKKLSAGGHWHIATDWEDYARHCLDILEPHEGLNNTSEALFIPKPSYRPETKFERRGQRLGHGTWDLLFVKPTE